MKILTNYDFNQNEIQNVAVQRLATAPTNPAPVKGQLYFNTTSDRLFYYNGTEWIGADSIGATMTGDSIIDALNGSSKKIDDDNLSTNANTAISNAHTHSNSEVLADTTASFKTAQETKLGFISVTQEVDLDTMKSNIATNNAKVSNATHTGDVTGATELTIANNKVTNAKLAQMPTKTIKGNVTTGTANADDLTASEVRELLNVADGANNYVHPNHTGDVTSTGDGATTIGNNKVTNAKLATVATKTFKGRNSASTGNVEDLSVSTVKSMLGLELTQKANATGFSIEGGTTSKKLTVSNTLTLSGTDNSTLNISTGGTLKSGAFANAYSHPTGDGNLHVPATSTTNDGKVLTAGGTAGSLTWETPSVTWAKVSNKPSSAAADIDDAVSKKHSQNTDTGTSNETFTIGTSGVKLKNGNGSELQVRNNADDDYADLRVKNLVVEGTTTTIKSETVELADNQLLLNSNITTEAGNENGGIAVKRLMANNTTRKDAEVFYDTSDERWKTKQGAVSGNLVSAIIANKVTAQIGNGLLTTIPVTHNLNTRDCTVLIRETASPYAMVMTDMEFTDLNTVTFKFAVAPTSNQYTVTIIG